MIIIKINKNKKIINTFELFKKKIKILIDIYIYMMSYKIFNLL